MKKILNFDSTNPAEIKRNQTIIISVIFSVFLLATVIYLSSTNNKKVVIETGKNDKNTISLSNSLKIDAEKEWISKSENDIKNILDENKKLQKQISLLEDKLEEQNKKADNSSIINQLIEEINSLKQQQYRNINNNSDNLYNETNFVEETPTNLYSFEFNLQDSDINLNSEYKNLDDYLPAGSYVSAKLISGVDASVGVSSQNDPRPVQFRITDYAIAGEYNGKKQKIKKVKGCLVLGAASGDLSSEKVFVRLLKMTCSFKENTAIEFDIKGYASAIGKAGIRGPVVSREGDLLAKSFWAGVIEGLGSAGSKALNPELETTNGITSYKYNAKDVGLQGLAGGVETSADKLSDYLIKRAEQYQPVISVQGGIDVELVFQSGVDFKKPNTARQDAEQTTENSIQNTTNIQLQNLKNYNTNIDSNGGF